MYQVQEKEGDRSRAMRSLWRHKVILLMGQDTSMENLLKNQEIVNRGNNKGKERNQNNCRSEHQTIRRKDLHYWKVVKRLL
jgi:hypothetical protein